MKTFDAKTVIALIEAAKTEGSRDQILDREINENFNLKDVIEEVAVHYIERAIMQEGNIRCASKVLGLGSYQNTLNWATRYGVHEVGKTKKENLERKVISKLSEKKQLVKI